MPPQLEIELISFILWSIWSILMPNLLDHWSIIQNHSHSGHFWGGMGVIWLGRYLQQIIFTGCPVGLGCKLYQLHLCRGVKPPHPPTIVLCMILNCIWWWGSSSGALGNVEYLFIAITPKSTLTQRGSTC